MTVMTVIRLPDGRDLDLDVSGPEGGLPLVYHHGTAGSVHQVRVMQWAAHERGLRLVTFSRPGYGASTRQPGRSVVDAASDVASVLGHLGVSRCLVAGWSGGGPHALATGARLPEQVAGILCIAGVAPYDAEGLDFLDGMRPQNIDAWRLAIKGEDAMRPGLEVYAAKVSESDAADLIAEWAPSLPDADRAVLTAEFGEDMVAGEAEAFRLGADGCIDDNLAFVKPWGFNLAEIAVPTFVWQGSQDRHVPFAHGQWLAAHVPGATVRLKQGEGHLSIGVGALDRMFDDLVSARSDRYIC